MPVALITGSAKRLGASIARLLHQNDHQVMIHYHRSEHQALSLCEELNSIRAGSAASCQADLHDPQASEQLVPHTLETFGRIDCLINNASTFVPTPLGAIKTDAALQMMHCNTLVPLMLAQQAWPYLKETQGCILNMLDIHGQKPLRDHVVYSASKAALELMTQSLAVEMAPQVRVNAIAPGAILWPEGSSIKQQEYVSQKIPLGRCGTPADIAQAALFLITQAAYVTGQILPVDGGRTASGYSGAAIEDNPGC